MQQTLDDTELSVATIRYYDEHGRDWVENESPYYPDATLHQVLEHMGSDPLVVDLGCGPARFVEALSLMGIERYIGVDASKTMLAIAKEQHPDKDFRLGEFKDLPTIVPELCDGFFCLAVLMQIPRASMPQTLRNIRKILRPGAIGHITTPHGSERYVLTHERKQLIPEGHALLLQQWSPAELWPMLQQNGFEIIGPTLKDYGMLRITVRAV